MWSPCSETAPVIRLNSPGLVGGDDLQHVADSPDDGGPRLARGELGQLFAEHGVGDELDRRGAFQHLTDPLDQVGDEVGLPLAPRRRAGGPSIRDRQLLQQLEAVDPPES